jgi:hypothetical protein
VESRSAERFDQLGRETASKAMPQEQPAWLILLMGLMISGGALLFMAAR